MYKFYPILKTLLFIALTTLTFSTKAQVTVALGNVSACTAGTVVTVPITVQNFTNIGAVSLDMLYDSTKLTYTGFNSSSLTGSLIVNNPAPGGTPLGRVLISWFSLTSSNIGNGLMMNLTFTANGSSAIAWNLAVAGQCELADGNGDVINNVVFSSGSVSVGGASIATQPVSALSLAPGASGSLSVAASGATGYQWQVSVGGGAWTNLTNGGGYSGVTTSTLGIVASSAMNGNQYRVQLSSGTCPVVTSSVTTLTVASLATLPTVTTTAASAITATGASTGGNVTADGGAAVTARGVAYGTAQNPTVSGTSTSNGSGTGAFTSALSGLTPSTLYYVRAYATNSVGTAYGNQQSFTTLAPPPAAVVLGQVSGCRGTVVTVPITVQNFTNIGAVSLDLLYDSTKLTYTGFNSSNLTGNLIVNNPAPGGTPLGRVLVSWFSLTSSNIGNGLMMNLTFTVNGSSAITWNTAVAGQCELADGNGDVISNAVFTSGSVTALGAQITTQPAPALSLNAGATGSLSVVASGATGYQWQVSVGGGAWTNLTNGGGYSGVTTSTLGIVASSAMNGNGYRVLVSAAGCADVASSSSTLTVISATAPTVTTTAASAITATGASTGGNVTADGGAAVTARGVAYGTAQNPTVSGTSTSNGSGTGAFTSALSGLTPSTLYYVRAYATNSVGTAYGNQQSFTTLAPPPAAVVLGQVSGCRGTVVTVPITVQNFTNIGAVSLDLLYDSTKLTYTGFNSSNLTGNLIVNNPAPGGTPLGRVLVSWFSLTSSNIGNGLMMNLTFTVNGSSAITWNTAVAGQCELADGNGDVISNAVFTSGSVTALGAQITTQPAPALSLNAGATGSLSVVASGATGYQWQVSVGGGAWTNLTNGGGYSGVTTSTLGIVASSAMNGNGYRVLVSAAGCADVASSSSTLTVISATAPTVTTTAASAITATGASTGGNVTADGGAAVTARGVAYGTAQNPTVSGTSTSNGSGTGAFTSALSGLTPSTLYYVRAYATNSVGTAYGNQQSFTTLAPPPAAVVLGQVSGCRGTVVTVPITVQNFTNIGAVSLDLLYDSTKLTYTGFNSSNLTGNLIVNNPAPGGTPLGRVLVSWFSLTSSNIGNGLMMNLTFTVNGSSAITWNTAVAGQCELADGNGDVISNAVFTSGSVTALGAQITTQPAPALSLNAGATGSLSVVASGATGYQWQVSVGGGAWTNLTNGGGYSGVTTSTLGIVASSAMNGNGYRVLVSAAGCADVASSSSTLTVISATAPTVTTTAASAITATGASTGGNVTADGGAAVTARGVAYGTAQNPTVSGTSTSNGSGTGAFTSALSGLTPSTLYYVRAYATNSVGTAYGNQQSFTTLAPPPAAVVLGQVSGCRGTVVTVPITVQNFTNIGAVSLDLLYDSTKLTYTGFNSSNLTGNLIVNNPAPGGTPLGRVLVSWFSLTSSNIGNGLMMNLTFTVNGSSAITWNTAVAGQCELADGNGDVISNAVFTSGSVTALGAQITTQPAPALSLNAGATGSLSVVASGATGYQWQVSVGGGAWTNLTNGGGYSGVTTSTLGIVASSAMNGNGYRVLVSAAGCADVASSSSTLTVISATAPTVTTTAASAITATGASTGGNVTADGGAAVTARGVAYGTAQNPTVSGTSTSNGSGTGAFTSALSGLTPSTLYYVRAYATNSVGTAYGNQQSFTTLAPPPAAVVLGQVSGCRGTVVTVPITVQNFTNIGAVSLDLLYDSTKLTYTGFNSSNLTGNLIVNNPAPGGTPLGRVLVSWFSLTSSNIGNGLMMNLTFTVNGSSAITWNTAVAGQCELADGNGDVISNAVFTSGSVTALGAQITTQPAPALSLNAGATGSLSVVASGATGYQWQVSVGGGAWTNLTNGGGYSGVTTSTLGIVASSAMNGNGYRVLVSAAGCADVASSSSTLTVISATAPTVTTTAASAITATGASTGGNVTADGGAAVTARGVAYGTAQNPTVSGTSTSNGSGTGAFTSALSGLTPSTLYYVRAYATNSVGTAYGNQQSFTTLAPPPAAVVLGQVSGCRGTVVTVPITVQNFTNIGAVSLDLLYDSTKLTYTGFNSSNLTGNLIVNNPAPGGTPLGRVLVSWFSLTSSNIGNGLMMNLTFTVNGSSAITWNTAVAGQCELADGNGDVISNAVFTSGSVTALGAQITTQPAPALSLNAGATGSLSVVASGATGYQWQVSVGGGAWTNLTNGGGYSGVTTSTLGIVASSAMNGNGYRVLVSAAGCADVASSSSTLTVITCLSQVGVNGSGDICVGGVRQLSASVAGGVWSSSNPSIASVGSSSGLVTGHSAGSVTIVYTITGQSGCPDVVASVTLAVNAHSATTLNATICAPAIYSFNGQTLNTSGVYTSTLANSAGCDSVVTLNLTVNQPSATTISETICFGNTFVFDGQNLTATGTYTSTLTNAAGCDSIVTLNLTVTPQPQPPTVACYETATFNTTTCSWDVTGTQPQPPTVACYETATFNTTTCSWDVTGTQPQPPTVACYETATFNTTTCSWDVTGTQPQPPTVACYETATFNTTTCSWDVTGTQPQPPTVACYETATFNTTTCSWDVTGTQPQPPTVACYETATFNTTTCSWDVTGTQPQPPTVACYETATFNTTTCSWDVTGTQPQPPTVACYETATFNTTTCSWDVTGTQPQPPTVACYETATFNTTTCSWDVTGTQPQPPTVACYETATFNTTTCSWDVTGTQPQPPTVACYETATFNTTTCSWDVTGTQPQPPTVACYETATFNTTTCSWDVTGTQPQPPTVACYETATFNTTTCSWDVTGTQPQPPTVACYETATFNTTTCSWDVTGTQPQPPTVACYETATFNTTTCSWDVTGTQPQPPTVACYETATFNTTTCSWDVTGTQPQPPTVACYETATFNTTTCSWDVTGTQPQPPTVACYETATFNTTTCSWDVTGTQPQPPTVACYETATFNTTTCSWDVTGTQPQPPTVACYETATFNTTTCSWDVTGTQPQPPTVACYETATFNTTTCSWDVTGTQPQPPTVACYETATFNTTTCSWDVTGTQPQPPTVACYETATFNTTTCSWDVTGTQPQPPTVACYETATFNTTTCSWDVTGTQPQPPTVACYETATFNTTTCSWDVTGTQPQPPTVACYETATFNTTTCSWDVTGTQPQPPTVACYETATFNTTTCSWDVTGTQPQPPTVACYETATFNTTTCSWDVTGTQPQPPTVACYETATFNTTTCSWDVTGTQPQPPTVACYETATFNTTTCSWDVTGTQPQPPTVACYETATFNTTTCSWDVTGTQPQPPTVACYETATFNTTTCSWDVTGTQPQPPTVACYETATFNTTTCSWDVTGTQPQPPTVACYETATFNTTTCSWDVTGTQPQPPTVACYETATFNTTTCSWDVTGTQPQPPTVACYETATFNTTTCSWDVTGTQPQPPTVACYETATFNTTTCSWDVTGTQPQPPTVACYETATFNTTTCSWDVTGTQPQPPTVACYETATFNTTTCSWDVTGTQPQPPTVACYETATFNTTTCSWDVTGTQPQPPTVACYETATFNTTTCSWDVTGTQPQPPTVACYETATFNTTTCSWDVTGTQPQPPTVACYETATFNTTTCSWDVTGTQPQPPTVACYETATFNTTTCSWDVTGTQPQPPTVACYETATFNTTTCSWDVTGTQPQPPTVACYETATFNTTTCSWDVTGTQPQPPTVACYETATFNTTTCSWDVTGTQPQPPTVACYETATFNTTTCSWDVTGTQPQPPTVACYETATFNTTTCSWDVTGTQPQPPTVACYETATFNTTTCSWDVTGTQPQPPTVACYETATFNTTTCSWDVTGTQPQPPTVACYETATFNTTTCSWDVTGTQPQPPTVACYETATFNTTTCSWDVTGTQPQPPTVACYETATFNTTTCSWDVTGTQPQPPTVACYETATFNTTTCSWDVTGTQPQPPTVACYETATFNTTTCSWDVTGTPNPVVSTSVTECSSYTWPVNGVTYLTSGTYNFNSNCQDYQLILVITPLTSNTTQVSSCDSYTWSVNGQTYTTSGTYNKVNGCHTEVLVLTVNTSPSYVVAINGVNYAALAGGNQVSTNTLTNYSINLSALLTGRLPFVGSLRVWDGLIGSGTPGPIFTDTIENVGDLIYSAPAGSVNPGIWGIEFLNVVDANGCVVDLSNSRYNFTFYVSDPNVISINEQICAPSAYNFNGVSLYASGTYLDTLTSSLGVDSFVTLNLVVNQPSSTSINASICAPASYDFNGQIITASGTYTDTLINAVGCDSVVTLSLTVHQSPSFTVSLNGNSYSAQQGGHSLNACTNNNYVFTLNGVQSGLLPLIGTIRVWDGPIGSGTPSQFFTDTVFASGDIIYSAPAGSVNPGIWSIEFVSVVDANGCSADLSNGGMNFTFSVSEPSETTVNAAICLPATYLFNGQTLNATGIYTASLTNAGGCDSTVTLNLSVGAPSPITYITDTLCGPNTIQVGGQAFGSTGNYMITLTNTTGCDSVIQLDLVATGGVTQITSQPESVYVQQGSNAQFSLGVQHAIAIQWQGSSDGLVWTDLIDGAVYSGTNTANLSIITDASLSRSQYRSVVVGCQGPFVSNPASLILYPSAAPIALSVVSATGCVGQEIQVPILASNFSNVGRIELNLNYNSSLLQLLNFQTGAGINGIQITPTTGGISIRRNLNLASTLVNDTLLKLNFVALANGQTNIQWVPAGAGVVGMATGSPNNMVHRLTYQSGSVSIGGVTPVISLQPLNATVQEGASATFQVSASNAVGYQWQVLGFGGWVNLSNQIPYQGVQTAQLTISPVAGSLHNRRYRVIVDGVCPPSVTSDEAVLSVIPSAAPVVLSIENRAVCSPGSYTLSVSASQFVGVNALDLSLVYSSSSMVFTGITATHSSLQGITANVFQPGVISVNWFGLSPSNLGSGELFKLNFSVSSGAAVSWNSSAPGLNNLVNEFGQNLSLQFNNGGVTVRSSSLQISGLGNVCINSAPVVLSANISGGSFSGTGVVGGVFYPATAGLGTNSINYTVTDSFGCTNTATVFVTVVPVPFTTGGGQVTVCSGSSATLTGAGTGVVSYLWSTGATTQSISVQANGFSVYWVRLTNAAGCSVTDTFYVSVFADAPVNAGTDRTICQGSGTQLGASGVAQYAWYVLGSTQPFALTSNPFVSPSATTTYVVIGISVNGCVTRDTVLVNVNARPNASVSNDTVIYCGSGVGGQLEASGGISYLWSPSTGLDNPNSATPVATPTVTTLYLVTVTNANGCSDVKSVLVLVPTVFAGSNRTICAGTSTQLNASYNGSALSYQWIPSTGLSNAFISNPVASPASSIIYTVRVTDASGCQVTSQVRVIVNPSPTVNAGADVSIAPNASTTINGFVSGATSYSWSPTTGLSNPADLNPVAAPAVTTMYILTASNSGGCSRSDTVVVTVDPNLSGGTISGRVVYDRLGNAVRTPVSSGAVVLSGGASATTNIVAGGSYSFSALANGAYQMRANVGMAAGGITTADAFLINNYLSNPAALTGLAIKAADANGDGVVNSADALLVLQRSINLPTAVFSTPWVSENAAASVSNSNPVRDVAVLSRGDVNRDYSFSSRLVRGIQTEGAETVVSDKPVHVLPILATNSTELGSFQMHVELASGLQVRSIRMTHSGEQVLFNQMANQLYLGWYATSGPLVASEGTTLFEVEFEQDLRGVHEIMSVVGFSQATDYEANPYAMLRLQMPVFEMSTGITLDVRNFPNPFAVSTEVIYQLPGDGFVQILITDYSGRTIYQTEKAMMDAGKHTMSLNAGNLADGVYILNVCFDGAKGTESKSTKLMIRR